MAAAGRQLSVVAAIALTAIVYRSWALTCDHCSNLPACGPTPTNCSYGLQMETCACCYTCANGPRESCGGEWGFSGRCGTGLECTQIYGMEGVCTYPDQLNDKFWLGGKDTNNKGQWEWINGHPIEQQQYPWFYHDFWGWNQPNDDKLGNCLAWNRYLFSDEGCHQQMKYICELGMNDGIISTEPTMSSTSPESNDGPTTNEPTITTTIPYNCENHRGKYFYKTTWRWNLCGVSTNTCTSLKDEHYCFDYYCQLGDGKYRCSSGHCISLNKLCDGEPDCPNEEDEQECPIVDCSSQGGIHIGRRCLIISEDELSWQEASTACIRKGGNLASFHDLLDLQMVQDYLFSLNDISETTIASSTNLTPSEVIRSTSSVENDPTQTTATETSPSKTFEVESNTESTETTKTSLLYNKGSLWEKEPFSLVHIIF